MVRLPDNLDPRAAYLVMLNGMEEATLYGTLAEIIQRGLCPAPETLPAAQSALRFLTSGGWIAVKKLQAGHAHSLVGVELEFILSSPQSWALPVNDEAPAIALEPTELGIAAWNSGFPILGLSEQTRSSLMFPPSNS